MVPNWNKCHNFLPYKNIYYLRTVHVRNIEPGFLFSLKRKLSGYGTNLSKFSKKNLSGFRLPLFWEFWRILSGLDLGVFQKIRNSVRIWIFSLGLFSGVLELPYGAKPLNTATFVQPKWRVQISPISYSFGRNASFDGLIKLSKPIFIRT